MGARANPPDRRNHGRRALKQMLAIGTRKQGADAYLDYQSKPTLTCLRVVSEMVRVRACTNDGRRTPFLRREATYQWCWVSALVICTLSDGSSWPVCERRGRDSGKGKVSATLQSSRQHVPFQKGGARLAERRMTAAELPVPESAACARFKRRVVGCRCDGAGQRAQGWERRDGSGVSGAPSGLRR